MEYPQYQSHKKVRALQIGDDFPIGIHGDGSVMLPIADVGYSSVTVPKEVVSRYFPKAGDFLVVYEDGYQSISPRKAFLDGYTKL